MIEAIQKFLSGKKATPKLQNDVKATNMFPNALKDMEQVSHLGGRKHGYNSWKNPSNPSMLHKNNHASMSRHLAEFYMKVDKDPESGIDPLIHLAWRALAAYERKVRGIK